MSLARFVRDEAQAGVELEALADPGEEGRYEFAFDGNTFDASPVIREIARQLRKQTPIPLLAARFHNSVAAMTSGMTTR